MDRREFLQSAAAAAVTRLRPFEANAGTPAVSLLLDASAGSPGAIAFEKVRSALAERQVVFEETRALEAARSHTILIAGSVKDSPWMAELGTRFRLQLPTDPESLLIERAAVGDKQILFVIGSDPLGLAYALYDVANRIAWPRAGSPPLSEVRDARESPAVRDRSLSVYSMQQAYFERRLFNEAYWSMYLDNLVRHRFNNFSMLFAYESSGFLAPPYAWFFDLPEFPEVKAAGVSKEQQEKYLRSLNRLIQMTHERGLKFTLGIWDHIYDGHSSYYTEGVWDHLPVVNGRRPRWPVEGLTDENLVAYTPKALEHFLELVPNIDGVQFRMHGESGLNKAGLKNFWVPIFRVMAQQNPPIRFDARAKEFPRDLIDTALQMGVQLRLTTKYLAEQVGPPFHAMHPQRFDQFQTRFSYFDMLRYPQTYKVQWRHWTSGTTRVLLWGDPEYVRRFAESTHLYDGDGYEVAEPLATKMASKPHDQPPVELLNPHAQYYDQEFQRYWAFFFAFGRIGYNPETPAEAWQKQFELHFGRGAAPYVEQAITDASGILPRVIGYSLPLSKFPTTRGWPERQRWDDLPDYVAAEPSDTQLFCSFQEEAHAELTGAATVKILPSKTSKWFAQRAKRVLANVAEAERQAGPEPSKEFVSTMVDLRILAYLAEYHSRRILAGSQYALFVQSRELSALDAAIAWERKAVLAWEQVVQAAGDVYADDLAMGLRESEKTNRPGADLSGHWRDELPKFRLGIAKLEKERDEFHLECRQLIGQYAFDKTSAEALDQLLPRKKDFSLDVANGFYELRFIVQDDAAHSGGWGPMWIEANGVDRTDAFTVKPGSSVQRTLSTEVRDKKLNVMLANESTGEWNLSRMIVTRVQPVIAHVPVRKVSPGEAVTLRATAVAMGEIRFVKAYWRDPSGRFKAFEMKRSGPFQYEATLPAGDCSHGGSYFLVAADDKGQSTNHPSAGGEQPFRVQVQGIEEHCSLAHNPVRSARPGNSLGIAASVKSGSGLAWVRLRYRSVNQYQDYFTLDMSPTGDQDQYYAEIPGRHIPAEWDFMYFFEVMDKQGNGHIFPDAEKQPPYVIVSLDRRSA
jgi:hypothetical protein